MQEHVLHRFPVQTIAAALAPCRHAFGGLQRQFIAAIDVHIHETGEDFMKRVVRRPYVFGFFGALDKTLGKGAEIAAVSQCFLTLGPMP